MEQPSAYLLDLLKKNNINGCMILLQEDESGDVKISHASDNIHEINVTQSLAAIIMQREDGKEGNWAGVIRNSADTILRAAEMIKDLAT